MMAGALLALFGAGVLIAAIVSDIRSDPDSEPSDTGTADDNAEAEERVRTISLLSIMEPMESGDESEVFVATDPRGTDGAEASQVFGFNPENDLVAFNISELAASCETDEGLPHFADPAAVDYDLVIENTPEGDGTKITLSLFDTATPGVPPVHYDVLLHDVTDLSEACISIVHGDSDLSQTTGGERVTDLDGTEDADWRQAGPEHRSIDTGGGDDTVEGTARDARVETGDGNDTVDLDATGTTVAAGDGDDTVDLRGGAGNSVDGGAGDDVLHVELGTDVRGGAGADSVSVTVPDAPQTGLPLFLWNQPVTDGRYAAHSWITLSDDLDTVHLALDPTVPGYLHRVTLTQETYGTMSSEVYEHRYTLVLWTPDNDTDITPLVTGSDSAFNGSLAQDAAIGSDAYEAAAGDPDAPRVILTIFHGTSFSGWVDAQTGDVSGAYDHQFDPRLSTNREFATLHSGEFY